MSDKLKKLKLKKPKFRVGQIVEIHVDGDDWGHDEQRWISSVEHIKATVDEVTYSLVGLHGMYPEARLKRYKK